jgi:hypothetical protein
VLFGGSIVKPQAMPANASTKIAEIILEFMENLLVYAIRATRSTVASPR